MTKQKITIKRDELTKKPPKGYENYEHIDLIWEVRPHEIKENEIEITFAFDGTGKTYTYKKKNIIITEEPKLGKHMPHHRLFVKR